MSYVLTPKEKLFKKNTYKFRTRVLHAGLLAVTIFYSMITLASSQAANGQSLQQQINNLNAQNQQSQSNASALDMEAANFQDTINALQAQIDAQQERINEIGQKRNELQAQITEAEAEIARQQVILGKNIRAMYLEGDMSTIEMIATSKSLSHYLDKEQYRSVVRDTIKATLDTIKELKVSLTAQKVEQERLLSEQQAARDQVAAQRNEHSRLLGLNKSEQASIDARIQSNSSRIAALRKQQAAENARLQRRNGGTVRNVPDTTGYPWANVEPFPNAFPDPWGMYKRQCVSYTAWKVYKNGKDMPYWGGRGNAKNWANNARADGIPVFTSPQKGDIAVSTRGTYGHVMYVEEVLSGGRIRISQYNAGWDGRYSEATISSAGYEYVRFR
ncbi:CHAP domain-containing protein [Candidatus Saccharibacteria bacterium]|nr:CHAP domain-containing protein [Candidatus Saccharibacteria bacterium]